MELSIQQYLRGILSRALGRTIGQLNWESVSGGSINEGYQIRVDEKDRFFCKINSSTRFPSLFEKESNGLRVLAQAGQIRVPEVLACLVIPEDQVQVLVLEWIESGPRTDRFWQRFGKDLASLHRVSHGSFGFEEDNYMGSLPQPNRENSSWWNFLEVQRLRPQMELALLQGNLEGRHAKQFERLFTRLPSIFPNEPPALLHGDLWSGNFLADQLGRAVLIDPAVYYGSPSMDLGMTILFGGFERRFYEAYNYQSPFPPNYREQWEISKLYPLLIHLNLFGQGYLNEIVRTIQSY